MALEGAGYSGLSTGPPPLAIRASFFKRLAAWLLDALVVGLVSLVITLLVGAMGGERAANAVQLPLSLLGWAYYLYFWHERGATPGKLALGLRIVNDRGEYPTWGQAIGRLFAQVLSAIPFFLGYFWALGEQRRTWHDLLAGTYVIEQQ